MDRFSEQSVSDFARAYRLSSRLDRDEDGYPEEPIPAEAPEVETPDEPILCMTHRRIIEKAQTVGQLMDRVTEHRGVCRLCGARAKPVTRTHRDQERQVA